MNTYLPAMRRVRLRVTALLLCFAILFPLLPFEGLRAAAAPAVAAWMQESMDKLSGWGVMRGDAGGLRPNSEITRAEYAAMINRAYGYDRVGKIPFSDVPAGAWYADDIAIGYTAGYFSGTSPQTASPEASLTREQAMVILARNMRLQESAGEVTEFTDGRNFSSWSKGAVKAAVGLGLVNGYPDGSFQPGRKVTRGEMARLLSTAVGTLLKEPGEYSLGGVYGNVTISAPGITLRNTTIAGDLYVTGGVDLGSVLLENVRVMGRIVSSGGGESNKGDSSVVLRNVEADNLVVNSLRGQYVTLRAEGDTVISNTAVLTGAYIEDRTPAGKGLRNIALEGIGTKLDLAGNIEEVLNKSPNSALTVAQGTTKLLTVDERAVGSSLQIAGSAVVKKLNLDVGTKVTGTGDVSEIHVNAPGSSTTMLPDTIDIRPGITANIAGTVMDTAAGQESSADPKLLAGYPKAGDVAPTTLNAVFAANKPGTVYWAISSIADGSVAESDLIAPPTYASRILKSGNNKLTASGAEAIAKVTGLTTGGSYYISAVLVDARGWRSAVKVISFTTPDDTVPNFAPGYPVMSKITDTSAQVTVMPTKSCKLYYAVLPKGSTAPKPEDFKSAAVTGNLGYGVLDVTKNVTDSFTVNNKPLEELVSYDLYLWLADADGGKSSTVKKITFATVDRTPPVFQTELTVNAVTANSIGFLFNLNENGTVYWVAVKQGTEYPKPAAGSNEPVDLQSDYAKLQVTAGMNGIKAGKTAAKANTDTSFTISGLEVQTAYDVYYVAVDTAGNYSASVRKITANTQDNIPPTVTQEFTRYAGTNTKAPLADTDVKLIFSEGVQRASTNEVLVALYQAVADSAPGSDAQKTAKEKLAQALRSTILLYNNTGSGPAVRVAERTDDTVTSWVIDYRNATVKMSEGKVIVTLPTAKEKKDSALNLSSGSTYYFQVEDIADTSSSKNIMGVTKLPVFTTISAQVGLTAINETALADGAAIDMAFSLTPMSTSKVEDTIDWDMLLWADKSVSFELHTRVRNADGTRTAWAQVGTADKTITNSGTDYLGLSVGADFEGLRTFPKLNQLAEDKVQEYAIHFTKVDGSSTRETWSQQINFRVSVVAGSSVNLGNLAANVAPTNYSDALASGVTDIGTPEKFTLRKQFTDSQAPVFTDGYPSFVPGDSSVDMTVLLDRPGTVYYVVAPVGTVTTTGLDQQPVNIASVPTDGSGSPPPPGLSAPGYLNIVSPKYSNSRIKTGSASVGTGAVPLRVTGLEAETQYYVYYVLKGTGQVFSDVKLYKFKTTEVSRPVIKLDVSNPSVTIQSDKNATVDYMLIVYKTNDMHALLKETNWWMDTVPIEHRSKTVLQAMYTDYSVGGKSRGSLFDNFARPDIKDDVANLIRSSTVTGNTAATGQETVLANARKTVTRKEAMAGATEYAFLAVGKSELGSGDAFRAVYPVKLPDTEPPKVQTVAAAGRFNAAGTAWTGDVTIVFNEDLFYYTPSDGSEPPTSRPVHLGALVSPEWVSAQYIATPSGNITLQIDESRAKEKTNIVILKFASATNGAFITFKTNLADGFGNTRTTPLTVKMIIKKDKDAIPYTEFEVTRAWDAR